MHRKYIWYAKKYVSVFIQVYKSLILRTHNPCGFVRADFYSHTDYSWGIACAGFPLEFVTADLPCGVVSVRFFVWM